MASFVYGLSTLTGVSMLASPFLRRQRFGLVAAGFGVIWIVGRCVLGYAVDLSALPIALTEASAMVTSQYLCLKVAQNTDEFVLTSTQMLQILKATSVPFLHVSEPALLDEIRRTRRHERPLTFACLTPGAGTSDVLAGLVQQLTDSLSKEYIIGGISRILRNETKSHDLAVRVGDQILLLLPETDAGQGKAMCRRIQSTVTEKLQIPMTTEVFAFGTDELTLSRVLDRMGMQTRDNRAADAEVFELRPSKPDLPIAATANAS